MSAPPQLDFAVILSQPREGPHASGLPREESTVRWVAPQLDFVDLLNQPRSPSRIGFTSQGSTGMRVKLQLDLAVLRSQQRQAPMYRAI